MNLKRSPIEDAVVLPISQSNNFHFGMTAQHRVADPRTLPDFVERDDEEVWCRLLYEFQDFVVAACFSDNFDIRLVGKSRQNQFPHHAGTISDENANCFFHESLRTCA